MLSKDMYKVLLATPQRASKASTYEEIFSSTDLNDEDFYELFCEAEYEGVNACDYIAYTLTEPKKYYRTEHGQAALEDYEQAQRNEKITLASLKVARTAMWVSVFSAIAALVSLIKMFV